MRNRDLIRAFYQGATSGKGSNLEIIGDKLVNYSTCILERTSTGGFIFNITKYSSTTSRIQSYIRSEIPENRRIAVSGMRIGCYTLKEAVAQ